MRFGQMDFGEGEVPPEAGIPMIVDVDVGPGTVLPDITATVSDDIPGVSADPGDILATVHSPAEAAAVILHTGGGEILAGADRYYGTPEGQAAAELAIADIVATRNSGGDWGSALARWGQQLGQAFVNAAPQLLNRIFTNPRTGQMQVRTQPTGLGALPWGWILGGIAVLIILPKVLHGKARGSRKPQSRPRKRRRLGPGFTEWAT